MTRGAEESIRRWFDAAVAAVDPVNAVQSHLERDGRRLRIDGATLDVPGRLFVAAIGKAAQGMATGVVAAVGDLVDRGLIITKDGHLEGDSPARFEAFEAAHPIPDARGIAATERLLSLVSGYGEGDVVLALISGGGSALMEAPVAGVSLADLATTTDLLLRAGAPIHDLNAARIPLSRVKGGGLRRAAPAARFGSLLLSDVLGNDPRVIASGPTVPADFTRADALEVITRYGAIDRVPPSVRQALTGEEDVLDDSIYAGDVVRIVGDNESALTAFGAAAERDRKVAEIAWRAKQGEARDLAREWVDLLASAGDADLLLGGGEATVTVRGNGEGGRNTEFALAAAIELEGRGIEDWTVASLATDGEDGTTGVAGAIVTADLIRAARMAGVDPVAALDANDSLAVFRAVGGSVDTGPTGTNVNDIYVAFRD